MGPDELIKAVPEVRNIVALIVGGIPLAEIVKSVVVPPFAVLGTQEREDLVRPQSGTRRDGHDSIV